MSVFFLPYIRWKEPEEKGQRDKKALKKIYIVMFFQKNHIIREQSKSRKIEVYSY